MCTYTKCHSDAQMLRDNISFPLCFTAAISIWTFHNTRLYFNLLNHTIRTQPNYVSPLSCATKLSLQPPNLTSMHKTITTYGRLISISSSNLLWAVGSQWPLRGPGLVVWHIPCSLVTRFLHPVFPIAVLVPMCWIRGLQ